MTKKTILNTIINLKYKIFVFDERKFIRFYLTIQIK
jgi:hypothetical protein